MTKQTWNIRNLKDLKEAVNELSDYGMFESAPLNSIKVSPMIIETGNKYGPHITIALQAGYIPPEDDEVA